MNKDRANEYPIPRTMKAWVLGNPEELALVEKPVPGPGRAEVLVRVDAIAVCATDIEILKHGVPAMIDGDQEHAGGALMDGTFHSLPPFSWIAIES